MNREPLRVGYVVKRYPRYSETFIVNEILAHEQAGLDVEIFSLRAPVDTHFQDRISRVRAPVTYLDRVSAAATPVLGGLKASAMWATLQEAAAEFPDLWNRMEVAEHESAADTWQAVRLAMEVKRRGIDHLHAHFASSATSVARMAAAFADTTFSFTAHAKDIFHEDVSAADVARKLGDASHIITVSDFNVTWLNDRFVDDCENVVRVYNGLDLQEYSFTPPTTRPPHILAVGRLVEKKGFGDLVSACAILADRNVEFRCTIIGSGDEEESLREQITGSGLMDSVALSGPKPQSQVIADIRNSAVFAAPCVPGGDGNRDGLPTVLLEAMALGTPCVSTNVTGIPEVVRHDETGLLVAQHDPKALADALQSLLALPDLRTRLARAARQLIETSFDVHHNSAAIRDLFLQTIEKQVPYLDESRPVFEAVV